MASNEELSLARSLYAAGKRLNEDFKSEEEEASVLHKLEQCLRMVNRSPTEMIMKALTPAMISMNQPYWLMHSDEEVNLLVTSCLSEMMRILAPMMPYDDDTMKKVLHLIVESFQDLDETGSSLYPRRVVILKTFSMLRTSLLLIDLDMQNQIYQLFHFLFNSTWSEQGKEISAAVRNILILIINEVEVISQNVQSFLLEVYEQEEHISPTAKKLIKDLFRLCEDKLKGLLMKTIQNNVENLNNEERSEIGKPIDSVVESQKIPTVMHSSMQSAAGCNETIPTSETHGEPVHSSEDSGGTTAVTMTHEEFKYSTDMCDVATKKVEPREVSLSFPGGGNVTASATKIQDERLRAKPPESEKASLVDDILPIDDFLLHLRNSGGFWIEQQEKTEEVEVGDSIFTNADSYRETNMEEVDSSDHRTKFSLLDLLEARLRRKTNELGDTIDEMMKNVLQMRNNLRSTTERIFDIFVHQNSTTSSQPNHEERSSSSLIVEKEIQILSKLDDIHRQIDNSINDLPKGVDVCCISLADMKSIKNAMQEFKSSLVHIIREKDRVAKIADKALEWNEQTKAKLQEVHEALLEVEN